jgi:hypothetical protein
MIGSSVVIMLVESRFAAFSGKSTDDAPRLSKRTILHHQGSRKTQ